MVPLIVAAVALAEPGVVRVAVSVGALVIPAATDDSLGGLTGLAAGPLLWRVTRVEVGGGRRWELVAVGQVSLHHAAPAGQSEGGSGLAGDFYLGEVGASLRLPLPVRHLRFVPRVTLGGALGSAPASEVALAVELGGDAASYSTLAYGAYGEAGLDIALPLGDSPVSVEAALDLGYVTIEDVGVTSGIRVGLGARL